MADTDDKTAFLRRVRQVRELRSDPVPEEALRAILEVGRWSGSSMNRQPWEFLVVQDRGTLQNLARLSPNAGHVGGAGMAILLLMHGKDAEMVSYDEGRLAERLLLAAEARGLGAAIGWLNDAAAAYVHETLGVPANRGVRTVVSLGQRDDAAIAARPRREQPRKPMADLLHEERY